MEGPAMEDVHQLMPNPLARHGRHSDQISPQLRVPLFSFHDVGVEAIKEAKDALQSRQ